MLKFSGVHRMGGKMAMHDITVTSFCSSAPAADVYVSKVSRSCCYCSVSVVLSRS
jgi:hypothetical protein